MLMGGVFIALQLFSLWGIPFLAGGAIMMIASFFLPESEGPVQPPQGFRFCPYCATPVALGAERCQHCNGLQPKE